jgi:hypothetical protein
VEHQLPLQSVKDTLCVQSPGGRLVTEEMVYQIPIELDGHVFLTNLIVLKGQDIDVILGMNWLRQRGAIIDTLNGVVQLNSPDSSSKLLIHLPTPKRVVERVCAATIKEVANIPIV